MATLVEDKALCKRLLDAMDRPEAAAIFEVLKLRQQEVYQQLGICDVRLDGAKLQGELRGLGHLERAVETARRIRKEQNAK